MRSHDKLLQQFRVGAAAGHARESERGISSVFSLWLAPFALLQKKKMEKGSRVPFTRCSDPIFDRKRERGRQRSIELLF